MSGLAPDEDSEDLVTISLSASVLPREREKKKQHQMSNNNVFMSQCQSFLETMEIMTVQDEAV